LYPRELRKQVHVTFLTSALIDYVLTPDKLALYYREPDKLIVNSRKLVKDHWSEEWIEPIRFNFPFNWAADYQKLMDNYIKGDIFPVEPLEGVPILPSSQSETGLEYTILRKWCDYKERHLIDRGEYRYIYPSEPARELGKLTPHHEVRQFIRQEKGHISMAVENATELDQIMSRLIIPFLFSLFPALEDNDKGTWPKLIDARKCQKPECSQVYVKYRIGGKNKIYCSEACGSAERQRRFRAKRTRGRLTATPQ